MKATLEIQNLKCGGCEATIYNKLSGLNNIEDLLIDIGTSTVTFNYGIDDDLKEVKEILFNIGYPVYGEANRFITRAKSYVSCAIGSVKK